MRQAPVGWARALPLALVIGLLLCGCAPLAGASGAAQRPAPATAMPTATPVTSGDGSVASQLAAYARRAIGNLPRRVTATYDAQKAAATVMITVAGDLPNTPQRIAAAYALVKRLTYQAMPALWSGAVALREVTVIVLGTIQDEYADLITDWYGVAVVGATTAQRMRWASLSPDSAWALYDQHILRASFELFD